MHSKNVLVGVDALDFITYIDQNWPGSVHDARVYYNSSLIFDIEQGLILKGQKVKVDNVQVPQMIIANQGYPLGKHLLIPYC